MLKQLDLNILTPESDRHPALYAGDSINMANLRIHFDEKDEAKVWQMLKDHKIMPAIWNFPMFRPTEVVLQEVRDARAGRPVPNPVAPQSTYDAGYRHPYRSKWRNWLYLAVRWVGVKLHS